MGEWGHTARKCTTFKGLYPNRNLSIIEHDFYVFENWPPFCFQRSHVSLWAHTYFHSCKKKVYCFNKMASCLSSLVLIHTLSRVAEVAREHGWHPSKSLDSDKNFKPEHTLFCRELRFVATHILEIFWQKKCLFGSKTVFLGQEVHYYMKYMHILLS